MAPRRSSSSTTADGDPQLSTINDEFGGGIGGRMKMPLDIISIPVCTIGRINDP